MSLINVNPLPALPQSEVTYLGGTMLAPLSVNYVAVIEAYIAGAKKFFLAGFAEEPTVSNSGKYVPVVDTEWFLLEEVGPMPTKDTLRKVRNHTDKEILESNDEELAFRVKAVLESGKSPEEMLEQLIHKDGVIGAFLAHQIPTILDAIMSDLDAAITEAEKAEEAHGTKAEAQAADLEAELPAGLQEIIAQVRAAGGSVEVIKLPA